MASEFLSSVELAEVARSIEPRQLSEEDIAALQRLLLDYGYVSLAGARQVWGERLREWTRSHGGAGEATLVGDEFKSTAPAAALANGTSAHGYELDDTHERSFTHPGAVVFPVALAVAEQTGASGLEVFAAATAGYEVMTRVGMASRSGLFLSHGRHPTCLLGPFGSATAAGKLLGFDAEQIANAWGIALSMMGGSMQFNKEPDGDMVKRMHAGIPAQQGLIAAQLTQVGVTGPKAPIEGEHGLFNLFADGPRPERLAKAPDAPFEIHDMSFKPYSCCRLFHSLIDAVGEATEDFSADPDSIVSIRAGVPGDASRDHYQVFRPASVMAAQYSLPYAVAAAIRHGPMRYDAFSIDEIGDPKTLAVADKIEAYFDEELAAEKSGRMSARVTICFTDGEEREAISRAALGAPEKPLDVEGIKAKGRALLTSSDRVERIAEAVSAFPNTGTVHDFTGTLGG